MSVFGKIYDALRNAKSGTADETNGRHIIPDIAVGACSQIPAPRILDVGAGRGAELLAIGKALTERGQSPSLYAVESFPVSVAALRASGIETTSVNIERDALTFPDGHFDVVICNQVFEHAKEIFWLTAEIARVVRSGGTAIIGVPNLASLHNRLALMFGSQPPSIHVLGPHIRGFTRPGMIRFLETGGLFRVVSVSGGNFYPFQPSISRPLSKLLPSLAVSSFFVAQRTDVRNSFLDLFNTELAAELVDTPYFRGV